MTTKPQTTAPPAPTVTELSGGRLEVIDADQRLIGYTQRVPGAPIASSWVAVWRESKTDRMHVLDASDAGQAARLLRQALQIGA